ncbi:MAG: hypothetical protein Q7S43_03925 [bacterium]|nr:hypothetical protein [bacterium]
MNGNDRLTVEFDPKTLADIFVATHLCEVEISGLAKVERDGRKFKVSGDALIFNQSCSLAKTEPDPEAINLYFNSIAASGDEDRIKNMESQTLWWHSHVWIGVIFSGTDFRTMKTLLSGFDQWWLVLVVNKFNQSCLALIEKNDGFLKYEETPIQLCPKLTEREFKELIDSRKEAIQNIVNQRVVILRDREPK